jgi:hypothetical protein
MTPLDAARAYIRRGRAVVSVPHRAKAPVLKGWQELRITEADAPRYFDGAPQNVGVILGPPSGWLVDADLDCAEALRLAAYFLPPTESVFGRASKPRSHWIYVSEVPKRVELVDPETGECLLELRSTGCQTVFPGSTHPSGEEIEWHEDGDPARVDPEALQAAAKKLGAACLLARAAPAEGRHAYVLDVSGALVRGLGAAGAAHLLHPVAREVLGGLYKKQEGERLLADTARKLAAGEPVSGWPKLIERVGDKRARKLAEWLELPTTADDAEQAAEQPWPAPLAPEAYQGIAGEIVRTIEPESEADPAALLFQLLAGVGNILGDGSFVRVEDDRHPPRLYAVQVGRTAKGRKGTSWGRIRSLLERAAPEWAAERVASGLSSGEGVIYEVRDPVSRTETDKKTGATREVVADQGVADKRLLVFEGELAKALRSMERQGNTLSAVLRDAWDHGDLRTLVKNDPNRATRAHVSLVGHITDEELRRYLDRTEIANGLANRLVFVCVQRSKVLPRGGQAIDWTGIEDRLRYALAGAPRGEIGRTEAAWRIWEAVYPKLSADRPGLLGAILGRAEAQVLRLALVYALLDRQAFVDAPHLRAALACWDYAEASARFVFGDSLGDPVADEILRALRERPEGMTRTELMHHFGRHVSSDQLGRALAVLARGNFARGTREQTAGRPVERWRATR